MNQSVIRNILPELDNQVQLQIQNNQLYTHTDIVDFTYHFILNIRDRVTHPILNEKFELTETIYEDWLYSQEHIDLFDNIFYHNLLKLLEDIRIEIENHFEEDYCPWGDDYSLYDIMEDHLTSTDHQFLVYIIQKYYEMKININTYLY